MKKRFVFYLLLSMLLASIIGMTFTACTKDASEEEANSNQMQTINEGEMREGVIKDYRDPQTGVHYIIYMGAKRSGMSVRYNADGTIMVD